MDSLNKDIDAIHRVSLNCIDKSFNDLYICDNKALGYNKFTDINGTTACILADFDVAGLGNSKSLKTKEEKVEFINDFVSKVNKFVSKIKPKITKINKNIKIEVEEKDYGWDLEQYKKKAISAIKQSNTIIPRNIVIVLIPNK